MKKKHGTLILIASTIVLLLLNPIGSALADNASKLEIVNLSGISYVFSYTQLFEMPKTVVYAELYCDGALTTYGNWSGVLLSYLLTQAQTTPEVGSIQFVASDGYRAAIPINLAMQPQVIIAYEKEGQPLTEGLRLIIPGANGASWIAKIVSMTMSTSGAEDPEGVSVGGPKANIVQNQTSTTQTPASKQQTPQPQPSSENSSSIQKTTPTNATLPNQSTINPQITNQNLNMQNIIVYLIGFTCAISITATVYMALMHKRKQTSKTSI
jgi:DMSO/TMAO reductase YedYZ molybdopterin-dependent catalytic subunit